MPTEPIRFDSNGEVVQPQVAEIPSRNTTTPWAALAQHMGGMFATDMGVTADPGPAISDMAYIGGDLHVRFVGSRRWEPVRHMSRAEAGLPSYTVGDNYATPWSHGNHPVRIAAADTAYDLDRRRRAEIAALNPTDQPPNPTRERLNPEWIETPPTPTTPWREDHDRRPSPIEIPAPVGDYPLPPMDYPLPPSPRRGRTAAERARDAAEAERRRISDPPHDGPPMAEAAEPPF